MDDDLLLELVFLRYFYDKADFGPADDDVRQIISKLFEFDTGHETPEGYKEED